MPLKGAAQLMILTILSCLMFARTGSAQSFSNQPSDDHVWRCSLDGKFYTVTNWSGIHIGAVSSGRMMADIAPLTDKNGRVKTDKKGNEKLEGRWGSTMYGGLIVIQDVTPNKISGFLFEPTPGTPASSCNSRTAAVLGSLGQPGPICNRWEVSFDLQPGISSAQAAVAEMQSVVLNASFSATQGSRSSDSDQRLVGTWFKERFDGYARYTTTLALRGDGTYTKSLIGTDHSGTWTSSGNTVHLSGDGHYPPTEEDLSLFRKTR